MISKVSLAVFYIILVHFCKAMRAWPVSLLVELNLLLFLVTLTRYLRKETYEKRNLCLPDSLRKDTNHHGGHMWRQEHKEYWSHCVGSQEVGDEIWPSGIYIWLQPRKVPPTLREGLLNSAKLLWTSSQTYPKVCSLYNFVSYKADSGE